MLVTTFFGDLMMKVCIVERERVILMTFIVIVANFLIHNIGNQHLEVANIRRLNNLSMISYHQHRCWQISRSRDVIRL